MCVYSNDAIRCIILRKLIIHIGLCREHWTSILSQLQAKDSAITLPLHLLHQCVQVCACVRACVHGISQTSSDSEAFGVLLRYFFSYKPLSNWISSVLSTTVRVVVQWLIDLNVKRRISMKNLQDLKTSTYCEDATCTMMILLRVFFLKSTFIWFKVEKSAA